MTNPLCPVTGEPAARFVQWVDARFLAILWKIEMGANARPSFGGVERFGLWQSSTGLYFFEPRTEGDNEFYTAFYGRLRKGELWREEAGRTDFAMAARYVKPGDRVLDVGCGFAGFGPSVPHAAYTGLDPNFKGDTPGADIRDETLRQHLETHAGFYDVVCAFQLIEHLREPVVLFDDMVRAAKPGGLIILSTPFAPSALTRIPNFLINAPPHHLTWWTIDALKTLAANRGTIVQSVETTGWGEAEMVIYWIERYSFVRCRNEFFRHSISWHAAALVGFLAGWVAHAISKKRTVSDEGINLLLVARRPEASA